MSRKPKTTSEKKSDGGDDMSSKTRVDDGSFTVHSRRARVVVKDREPKRRMVSSDSEVCRDLIRSAIARLRFMDSKLIFGSCKSKRDRD